MADTIDGHLKLIRKLEALLANHPAPSKERTALLQKRSYHRKRIAIIEALCRWRLDAGQYAEKTFRPRKRVLTPRVSDPETTPEKPLCSPHDFS